MSGKFKPNQERGSEWWPRSYLRLSAIVKFGKKSQRQEKI